MTNALKGLATIKHNDGMLLVNRIAMILLNSAECKYEFVRKQAEKLDPFDEIDELPPLMVPLTRLGAWCSQCYLCLAVGA